MKNPLLREITLVIVVKLMALFAMWWFFFSPEHKVQVTPEKIEQNFFHKGPSNV